MRLASTALPINSAMPSRLKPRKRRAPVTASLSLSVSGAVGGAARAPASDFGARSTAAPASRPAFCKMRFVRRHGVGDLADQPAQFADLGGDRIGRAARAVHGRFDPAFHGVEPARHLGHLAGEVGGAARQIGDLVAEVAAVAQAVADGIVERHAGERGQRHDRGGARRPA